MQQRPSEVVFEEKQFKGKREYRQIRIDLVITNIVIFILAIEENIYYIYSVELTLILGDSHEKMSVLR